MLREARIALIAATVFGPTVAAHCSKRCGVQSISRSMRSGMCEVRCNTGYAPSCAADGRRRVRCVEDLDGVRGDAHIQRLADQLGGNRVEILVDLHVIVGFHFGFS